jgi:hypothetical protein
MSLDLPKVSARLLEMTAHLRQQERVARQRLQEACATWEATAAPDRWQTLRHRLTAGPAPWPLVEPLEPWDGRRSPPAAPAAFRILATDGSHMDVDRARPARCAVINIGYTELTYGPAPSARLGSTPHLLFTGHELTVADEFGPGEPLEGGLLSLKRAVLEAEALAELAQGADAALPTLALLDGSLVLWGVGSFPAIQRHELRRSLLEEGYLRAWDALQRRAAHMPLAFAGYISHPRSAEVVNLLRIAVCPMEEPSRFPSCRACAFVCGRDHTPCEEALGGLLDRDLFWALLEPGERSPLFRLRAQILETYYQGRHVAMFYLHTGQEIARVEVPEWVATDEALLAQAHALVWDQVQRGRGYPVAVQEAHERAVITGAERELFWRLVERAFGNERLPIATSAKRRSKGVRWL